MGPGHIGELPEPNEFDFAVILVTFSSNLSLLRDQIAILKTSFIISHASSSDSIDSGVYSLAYLQWLRVWIQKIYGDYGCAKPFTNCPELANIRGEKQSDRSRTLLVIGQIYD